MKLNKRPNWLLMGAFTYLIIAFMGYVGLTRSYGRGLSEVKPTQSLELSDFFLSGFSDAQVFQTTGLMIHGVPLYYSHTGFLPLLETIALPVPRAFWPEKPTGQSLEAIFNVYHAETGYRMAGMGAAELNYGEHYVAFGWMGVIVLGLITGLFFRIAWDSYKNSSGSEIAIIFIAVFNAFIYVVISRGYLPQVVLNFFFTVFPVLVIYWKHWKIVRM